MLYKVCIYYIFNRPQKTKKSQKDARQQLWVPSLSTDVRFVHASIRDLLIFYDSVFFSGFAFLVDMSACTVVSQFIQACDSDLVSVSLFVGDSVHASW